MTISISNFTSDPFAIATISFGVLAWIVSIAGAGASDQSSFPHFAWWGIVYEILIIILIFLLYLNNNIELYKFTLVGLVAVAFVYTTNSTNNLIYDSSSSGNLACAAGNILLSILNLIWILYFGGHPESPTNQFIDSFSLKNHHHSHGHIRNSSNNRHNSIAIDKLDVDDEDHTHDDDQFNHQSPFNSKTNEVRQSQLTNNANGSTKLVSSSQLNGLENFSSSDVNHQRDLTNNNNNNEKRQTVFNDQTSQTNLALTFRYKAKALYGYDANPDDINEISFVKDEILEVDDIDGKWWQARRSNGQIGICPSNYVKLIT
ncbi:high osmolarity signaling protein SHO1 [Scheffersomyces coipomensis]|uniref:high osmolarity signaling protein SHO1 n=1 Tax=Scheffersomyces coipomensis TaxID=1788519 RepID=UPI00315D122A